MSEHRKAYIAGPMAGIEEFNYPAFFGAEALLQRFGFITVNPARLDEHDEDLVQTLDFTTGQGVTPRKRADFLKRDFQHLTHCDVLVLLPGWQNSAGANCELWVARMIGLDVYTMESDSDGDFFAIFEAPSLMPMFGPMIQHVREQIAHG